MSEYTEVDVDADIDEFSNEISSKRHVTWLKILGILFVVGLVFTWGLASFVTGLNKPPSNFPVDVPVVIESGTTVRDITDQLELKGVVRSSTLLYLQLAFYHDTTEIKASAYVFDRALTSGEVAARLTEGDFDTNLVRLTHIEGERVAVFAERAAKILPSFDAGTFVQIAEPYEGKLFPETYLVPPTFTEEELLSHLLSAFDEFVAEHQNEIEQHSLSLDEIVVLASIIEREANSFESMKMVSGILQNRLEINMPLQADASIEYVLDKPLADLVPDDLKVDSPYNTYTNTGLPPTPIGNPGRDALMAVLEPTESDYFYYITDENGEFHYSETYSQHLRNIERYLR